MIKRMLTSDDETTAAETLKILEVTGAFEKVAGMAEKNQPVPQLLGKLFQVPTAPKHPVRYRPMQVLTLIAKRKPTSELSQVAKGAIVTIGDAHALPSTLWAFAFLVEIAHFPQTIQVTHSSVTRSTELRVEWFAGDGYKWSI